LGLGAKAHSRPAALSGGEQQRVAIAVALANRPQVLFADEPTGELDVATGEEVFAALRAANTELGTTVVIVTHDAGVSSQVQRTVAIRDGRTSSEVIRRAEVDEDGTSEMIAEEYAVLDRAGRLQLPADFRRTLGLRDRVRLELESDHVGVWPDGQQRDREQRDGEHRDGQQRNEQRRDGRQRSGRPDDGQQRAAPQDDGRQPAGQQEEDRG
jgi:energy-coupling factor transporter ATP-binding protein EcfA2